MGRGRGDWRLGGGSAVLGKLVSMRDEEVLHAVHGSMCLRQGGLRFPPLSGFFHEIERKVFFTGSLPGSPAPLYSHGHHWEEGERERWAA